MKTFLNALRFAVAFSTTALFVPVALAGERQMVEAEIRDALATPLAFGGMELWRVRDTAIEIKMPNQEILAVWLDEKGSVFVALGDDPFWVELVLDKPMINAGYVWRQPAVDEDFYRVLVGDVNFTGTIHGPEGEMREVSFVGEAELAEGVNVPTVTGVVATIDKSATPVSVSVATSTDWNNLADQVTRLSVDGNKWFWWLVRAVGLLIIVIGFLVAGCCYVYNRIVTWCVNLRAQGRKRGRNKENNLRVSQQLRRWWPEMLAAVVGVSGWIGGEWLTGACSNDGLPFAFCAAIGTFMAISTELAIRGTQWVGLGRFLESPSMFFDQAIWSLAVTTASLVVWGWVISRWLSASGIIVDWDRAVISIIAPAVGLTLLCLLAKMFRFTLPTTKQQAISFTM